MERAKFFRCNECGNIVAMMINGGGKLVCCGQPMEELVANTVDAAKEKHVPVVHIDGDKINVKVGAVPHPMEAAHYIQWIAIETTEGVNIRYLKPGDKPEADFCKEGKVVAVYEYCNLHGLWKTEL